MGCRRQGELEQHFLRSDRLQDVSGRWRVRTREGTSLGPYGNREAAANALHSYVDSMKEEDNRQLINRFDYLLDCNGATESMSVARISALLDDACHRTATRSQRMRLQGLRSDLARRHPEQRVCIVLRRG